MYFELFAHAQYERNETKRNARHENDNFANGEYVCVAGSINIEIFI